MYNSSSFLSHSRIVKGVSLLCLCVALVSALMLAPMGFAQAAIPTLRPAPTQVLAPPAIVKILPNPNYPASYCWIQGNPRNFVVRLKNVGNGGATGQKVTVSFGLSGGNSVTFSKLSPQIPPGAIVKVEFPLPTNTSWPDFGFSIKLPNHPVINDICIG
jgi:hypothetical protein